MSEQPPHTNSPLRVTMGEWLRRDWLQGLQKVLCALPWVGARFEHRVAERRNVIRSFFYGLEPECEALLEASAPLFRRIAETVPEFLPEYGKICWEGRERLSA